MKLIRKDFWSIIDEFEVACITTNGFVKKNGDAVMGRGIAKEAAIKYPQLPTMLGDKLKENGNKVQSIDKIRNTILCAFPVKHNWYEEADINLIRKSCKELMDIINKHDVKSVLLNMPGVGNGKLDFNTVKFAIEELLDDRVTVVYK
ncbi:MAG: ADP-ribose-binding protein [Bacilli bacterium]|nr:ADP-ribose-binding protein [Bacilli bacterium]